MTRAAEILRDFNQQPGFGERQEVIPERDPSPPLAEPSQPSRSGVLGEVEALKQKQSDEAERHYLATVAAFVTGEADPATIQAAIEAAGKTISDFESDAAVYRERIKLLETIATEAAEQTTLADLSAAIRAFDRQRQEAATRLLEAKAEIDEAESLKQAAERERWSVKHRIVDIGNAKQRLQQEPYLQFASGEEAEAIDRLNEIQLQHSKAEQERADQLNRMQEIHAAMETAQTRLRYVQRESQSLTAVKLPKNESDKRQSAQQHEIESLQAAIRTLGEQLSQAEQGQREAEAKIETLQAEAAEAREQFSALLA